MSQGFVKRLALFRFKLYFVKLLLLDCHTGFEMIFNCHFKFDSAIKPAVYVDVATGFILYLRFDGSYFGHILILTFILKFVKRIFDILLLR